jgi:hypothetical protein
MIADLIALSSRIGRGVIRAGQMTPPIIFRGDHDRSFIITYAVRIVAADVAILNYRGRRAVDMYTVFRVAVDAATLDYAYGSREKNPIAVIVPDRIALN